PRRAIPGTWLPECLFSWTHPSAHAPTRISTGCAPSTRLQQRQPWTKPWTRQLSCPTCGTLRHDLRPQYIPAGGSLMVSLPSSTALIPYLGHGEEGATAWLHLAPSDRRRTAMGAAHEHDAATLWSLTEAWLRTFSKANTSVAPSTVRGY